ncbi:MAG: hypothetical protein MJA29_10405, partial [Candidatus Omnitrophica bacterium]|nr:hypothetical protein [Candidatus Omnitrophota bacterium]
MASLIFMKNTINQAERIPSAGDASLFKVRRIIQCTTTLLLSKKSSSKSGQTPASISQIVYIHDIASNVTTVCYLHHFGFSLFSLSPLI